MKYSHYFRARLTRAALCAIVLPASISARADQPPALKPAKQDTAWKRYAGRFTLPATAKTLRIDIGPHGATGVIDFDDVVMEFR